MIRYTCGMRIMALDVAGVKGRAGAVGRQVWARRLESAEETDLVYIVRAPADWPGLSEVLIGLVAVRPRWTCLTLIGGDEPGRLGSLEVGLGGGGEILLGLAGA